MSSGEMQAVDRRLSSHTLLSVLGWMGRMASLEQQGLLKEVVLVGVSPDASRMLRCLWWFHGSWLATRDQEGDRAPEKQAGRSLLCELPSPVLRSRSVCLQ